MPTVTTKSATVDFSDVGDGAPVILLHATLHDRSDFDDIADDLARTRRVIAIDWPGHGESPLPIDGREPGVGVFADVLEEFVDELDLKDIVVIGNSVGGTAGCRLAATRPNRVAGVVTANGAGFTPNNAVVQGYCRTLGQPAVARCILPRLIKMYMRPQSTHDREIVERVTARARSESGSTLAAAMWRSFATQDNDLRPYASQIAAPTLVTWGKKDLSIPRIWADRPHRAIAGSQFAYLNTGHIPFTSDPQGFLGLALPFIASLDSPAKKTTT
jgi:pimeloyl-ACP methyl ester carboxylesterase